MNAIGVADALVTAGPRLHARTFDEFYAFTQARMLRLAKALVLLRTLAEDLVQDAFASSYARFASLEHPEACVRRCMVNHAYGAFRRRRVARSKEPLLVDSPPPPGVRHACRCVDGLPGRQRAALSQGHYEQCTEQEIAAALKCRPGTVKSLLSRVLAALREVIEP